MLETYWKLNSRRNNMAFRVTTDNGKMIIHVEGWHVVDGKWRHIVQDFKDGEILYYTDGVEERRRELNNE